jgi:2-polyprenyl-6-methoxyphenol hydroxylase-like FAD-dependent oxidoreductase
MSQDAGAISGGPAGRRAAVVGAGIGGLAAGIALGQAGWEVTVYEAATELRPVGAGIGIWPNGVRSLRALGLDALVAAAARPGTALRTSDGSFLGGFESRTIEARFGEPFVAMHRADLHGALLDRLGAGRLRLGMRLTDCAGEELRFADGSSERADLVVGADGINSVVRAGLIGDGEPRDSGLVAFRGVAHFDGESLEGEWWGPHGSAGMLRLGGGRVYWFVCYRGEPDTPALQRYAADYDPALGAMIERTPEDEVLLHRLFDRRSLRGWSRGSTTLLGDAAHPMLPFLGQGACAALDDAVALGEALAAAGAVPAALARYERSRVKRAAALVTGSRRMARVIFIRPGPARRLRDALTARLPESLQLRQLDPFVKA